MKPAPPEVPVDDGAKRRIIRLEQEIKALREDNSRLYKEGLGLEGIKELIGRCRETPNPPKWLAPKHQPNLTGVPLLFASDWHWDETVDPRQVNGVNAYSRSIAVRRCETFFKRSVDLLINHMAKPRYDYATLILGGDMLSGNIHEELRETNHCPIAVSMMSVLDHLIAGITLLHNQFGRLYIPAVVGNHGRFDKKPRAKNRAFDNYEWIVYQYLAKHFEGETDITFDIADGAELLFQVYNTKYCLVHGDQAKGGSGIAGALSPLMLMDHRKRKRAMATNQPYHLLIMGHWHQWMVMKNMIVNGSLKGWDEWTASMNFDFEVPTQGLWITHPDHHMTASWPIYLEKPGARFKEAA